MNRRSTVRSCWTVIGKLRARSPASPCAPRSSRASPARPRSSSRIVQFVKEVQFDRLGCFAYSAEENTVAAKWTVRSSRKLPRTSAPKAVMQIQTGIMAQKQAEKVGQTVQVSATASTRKTACISAVPPAMRRMWTRRCVSSEEPLYPGQFYLMSIRGQRPLRPVRGYGRKLTPPRG